MSSFFPRHTVEWRLEEPAAFRRLSLSLFEMALLAGIVLRVLRALVFAHGHASWLFYGVAFLIGVVIRVGMSTAYLANWTLRSWAWRAPLFAFVEVVGEMITSLLLIALHRELEGSMRAEFHDWPSMALRALFRSELTICVWALVLAGAIVFVRRSGMAEGVESEPLDSNPPAA